MMATDMLTTLQTSLGMMVPGKIEKYLFVPNLSHNKEINCS